MKSITSYKDVGVTHILGVVFCSLKMDISQHSSVIIGDNLYIWKGDQPDLPKEHDSPEKRRFTSSVDVYNIADSSFVKRQTTGTPPNGVMGYSCCSIGNDIYYFGGSCSEDCFHNNLFTLNTITNDWREVITSNNDEGPMKKDGCGMIPFSINNEDYILVIGGYGPLPSYPSSHTQYTPNPNNPSRCYTNEVHIMCVSTTPGNWSVPMITGSVFPSLTNFSINTLPGNRAIVFGGISINKHKTRYYSNDVFILSYTDNSVDFVKVAPTTIHWPKGRGGHSSVVISGVHANEVKNHYLVVLGGWGDSWGFTDDCYIMNIDNKEWKQISLPKEVVQRFNYSMSCCEVSVNCVWLIVTGGMCISSPNRLMIVKLVFSSTNDEWTVASVTNENNIKSLQVSFDRLSRKRLAPSEEIMKDYEEQKQMIAELQSDLHLCKVKLKEKEEEIKRYKVDHLQEVERKLSGDKTMELPIQEHSEDTNVNYCEVFKDHYDSLVKAMVTSCSLSNVACALKSVKLVSQSAVDFVSSHRIATEPDQCVTRLLKELMTFLQISTDNSKKREKMVDFCKVLHDQDSPVLSEMASQLSDKLGTTC